VHGEVIAALLLGARRPKAGRVPRVRLAGARIVGPIDVSGGAPVFDRATCRQVRLDDCVLPGFTGRLLDARGSLRLESCDVRGPVVLRNGTPRAWAGR